MPFTELQSYNFEPSKNYRVHINKNCMLYTGIYNSPLPTFLKSKTNIVEAVIDNDVTSIKDEAFNGCSSLTSVTIPNGVTSIGDSAFYRCSSLASINIPDSVTSMGYYVFNDCEKITITYNGTIEQWNSINSTYFSQIPKGRIIHCIDGDIEIQEVHYPAF